MSKDSTSSDMGTKARAMKTLMQTCTNLGSVTQTTILCTNHVYDDPTALFPSIEKNMPELMSILYRPVTAETSNGVYTIAAYDGDISIRAEQMKKMAAEQVEVGGVPNAP